MRLSLLSSPWRWPALLASLCAVLAVVIAIEVGAPPDIEALDPPPAAAETVRPPPVAAGRSVPFAPPPLEDFTQMVERPLFQASRRPPPPGVTASAATPLLPDTSIQLAGVVLGGGRRIALLQAEGSPRPVPVEVGGEFGGWKVAAISPEKVSLRQGETVREVTLEQRMKAVAAAAPARAAAKRPAGQPDRGRPRTETQPGKMPARQVPSERLQGGGMPDGEAGQQMNALPVPAFDLPGPAAGWPR